MILLDRITKIYPGDEEPALDNVSLHIEPHEFVFLVGKSGAGKSTLIKMITKEEQPDSGKIIVGGIDLDYVKKRHVPHYRRRLGVVFQDYKLLPTRTVFENVAFALEIAGMSGREIARTVPKVLELVGLSDKEHKFPNQLSGGEQQRVSIARSVARQPKILIADEPTGNLDKLTRHEIIDLLQKINDFGTTLLVTTHDENIVNDLGKRVVTLKNGRIVDDQKVNGVYRLDSEPLPEVEVVQRVMVPGARIMTSVMQESVQAPRMVEEESLKILHPAGRKVATPSANVAGTKAKAASAKAPSKVSTSAKAASTRVSGAGAQASSRVAKTASAPAVPAGVSSAAVRSTRAASAATGKKLAQDSANQWYTANRPLKSAPKLSDFSLGQTVKLKPAPSMREVAKKVVIPKTRQKRVI